MSVHCSRVESILIHMYTHCSMCPADCQCNTGVTSPSHPSTEVFGNKSKVHAEHRNSVFVQNSVDNIMSLINKTQGEYI